MYLLSIVGGFISGRGSIGTLAVPLLLKYSLVDVRLIDIDDPEAERDIFCFDTLDNWHCNSMILFSNSDWHGFRFSYACSAHFSCSSYSSWNIVIESTIRKFFQNSFSSRLTYTYSFSLFLHFIDLFILAHLHCFKIVVSSFLKSTKLMSC